MRAIVAALAIGFGVCAGTASAGTIENAFGNTITVTSADGATSRFHFSDGGAYEMVTPDNQTIAGAWAVNGEQICLTPAGGEQACYPYDASKNVGDTWTSEGNTLTIVAGQ